jgi:tetratricopeptide (TPR) repeat protein
MKKPASPRRRHAAWLAIALASIAPAAVAQPMATTPAKAPPSASPTAASEALETTASLLAGSAESASNKAKADELRRRGNRAVDEGRLADAIGNYEEAARLSPDPKIAYNLGAAYQKTGRNAEALTQLLRFKTNASREELGLAPNLDVRIAALRNKVAFLKVHVNVVGARVFVRDTLLGTKPAEGALEASLNEGRASVEISHEGYKSYRKEHTLQGGSSLELEVQLHQQAAPTTVVEKQTTIYVTSTPFWSQWWFWAGTGVLLAGSAATVYALSTEKAPGNGDLGRIVGPLGVRASNFGLRF